MQFRNRMRRLRRIKESFTIYRMFIRPFLFLLDPEDAHNLVFRILRYLWAIPGLGSLTHRLLMNRTQPQPIQIHPQLRFENPVGLAAGFDKNGSLLPGLQNLGFGFIEIGTVTPEPQLGNPKPRMFRIPNKRALVNRMGFNNDGSKIICTQLRNIKSQLRVPVGVNLGKNRDVPNSEAIHDYEALLKEFQQFANYFVINVSSPNTPGLKDLQNSSFLEQLGKKIKDLRIEQPVFLKLSPDLSADELKKICTIVGPDKSFCGLILANTLPTDLGGMSGAPIKQASINMLTVARRYLSKEVPIISVGGIESAEDVIERFSLGATAVQIYSGLIFDGPGLVGRILRGTQAFMHRNNIQTLQDLYPGTDLK